MHVYEIDRKKIACIYIKFWFWIDLIVTLPYDIIIGSLNEQAQNISNLAKFVRIMKIVRLVRLLKLIKVAKDRERLHSLIHGGGYAMSSAFERLIWSVVAFFLLCHVLACIWIIQAKL